MSVGDLTIDVVIFLIQKLLLPILPSSIPFFSYETFLAYTESVKKIMIYAFSGVGILFPIDLILLLILVVIFAESFLMIFKMGKFIINLVRGSGA